MRAIYHDFQNASSEEILIISGDAAHHLNVVRVRAGERIILLNGKGKKLDGTVKAITKSLVEIEVSSVYDAQRSHEISLAVANPKKEAFEDILKMAVELGVKNIYPLSSEFSQYDYVPSDRVQRILESALIQSNNPFFPEIYSQISLKNFLESHKEPLAFFNSRPNETDGTYSYKQGQITILIGPEGGFSPNEVTQILKFSKIQEIHLPTPILRAPTAVASSIGYLLASKNS